ncbi:MAG: hypothetical protein WD929_04710 [Steroidobacteraceae bacterium]
MTSGDSDSLAGQRMALREKIRAQRQLIAGKLDSAAEARRSYPRSNIMRFLTKRPGLSVTLLAELAALLLGPRYARSLAAFMAVARIVRTASNGGPRTGTAERPAGERSATL